MNCLADPSIDNGRQRHPSKAAYLIADDLESNPQRWQPSYCVEKIGSWIPHCFMGGLTLQKPTIVEYRAILTAASVCREEEEIFSTQYSEAGRTDCANKSSKADISHQATYAYVTERTFKLSTKLRAIPSPLADKFSGKAPDHSGRVARTCDAAALGT